MTNKDLKQVEAPPSEVFGYMPQDVPPWGASLSLGFPTGADDVPGDGVGRHPH